MQMSLAQHFCFKDKRVYFVFTKVLRCLPRRYMPFARELVMRFIIVHITYVGLLALSSALNHAECLAQPTDGGIGFVVFPGGDSAQVVVYSKPDISSHTVATLRGWDCVLRGDTEKTRALLVGFGDDSEYGLPIQSLSHDSSWARVSVEWWGGTEYGWVDLRVPNSKVNVWADFLLNRSFVLKSDAPPRFYSKPHKQSPMRLKIRKFPHTDQFSYICSPLRRQGRWLLVELHTPFDPCGNSPEAIKEQYGVKPSMIRVWVEYIDERGRPLIRPAMDC